MVFMVTGRNGDEILPQAVEALLVAGRHEGSRNGPVITFPGEFAVKTLRPRERVMFNPWRRINPFLHLVDGLSILSNVNSVIPFADITERFKEFSDDGVLLRGHYGSRLFTQLPIAVRMLNETPNTRRVALSMWDSRQDLGANSKDIPCNLMVVPRIHPDGLDITVFNRSNDLLWGMLGANIVQFSFLQEFLAAATGSEIGVMTQISTNAHIYTNFGPGKRISMLHPAPSPEYALGHVTTLPLCSLDYESTIRDVQILMSALHERDPIEVDMFSTYFFQFVVAPMMAAHQEHKKGDPQAVDILPDSNVDWIVAGRRWLNAKN